MSLTGKPTTTDDSVVTNDGFFPDVVLSDFLLAYRIPAEYADESVINAVELGIVTVNLRLKAVKSTKIAEDFMTLIDCLDAQQEPMVNGKYTVITLYQKSVFSYAKSWLIQQFNAMNRRSAVDKDSLVTDSADYWLEQSESATLSIVTAFGLQGVAAPVSNPNRAYVELI